MTNLSKGHVIQEEDIGVLRTEKILSPGISPEFFDEILGKQLTKNVTSGAGVEASDFN